jgi:hypothetical protein
VGTKLGTNSTQSETDPTHDGGTQLMALAFVAEYLFSYSIRLRRRTPANPKRLEPSSTSVLGSGVDRCI